MTTRRGLYALRVAFFVQSELDGTEVARAFQMLHSAIKTDSQAFGIAQRVGRIQIDTGQLTEVEGREACARGILDGIFACVDLVRDGCMEHTKLCIDLVVPILRDAEILILQALVGGLEMVMALEDCRLETNCGCSDCPVHGHLNGGDLPLLSHFPVGEC